MFEQIRNSDNNWNISETDSDSEGNKFYDDSGSEYDDSFIY